MVPDLLQHKYVVARRLIEERMATMLYHVLLLRHWRGETKGDTQVPNADSHWGDSTLDAMLLVMKPEIERICGCALLPTYAYARLYFYGDSLPHHRDRAACQIAATIHLGASGDAAPPIWFAPSNPVSQVIGDAVIYLGDRIEHWREPFGGETFGQLFLNYVFAEGERTDLTYDGRHGAFPPSISQPSRTTTMGVL
jgi:hypothetical protein